ncbi:MAG TPA: cytochrome bc complex cytochrome b subunit, partial [Alphaproteobacteria bacterium]|nr:cytochrome bc complex cytochrome b subunit [Alphaproteobacteria bacterium]
MMNSIERTVNGVMDWVNERAPGLMPAYRKHMTEYYAPKNFNLWYYFGSLAMLVLVNQIVTGIFLTMHYKPDAAEAFNSVEYIMRDVQGGWLIRYMHTTGASLFFIVVYLHMFRGLIYGSYQKPRELVWILGMLIFLTLMAEAFMGYVLPWGQMSYWGAQVIINLFGTIPVIGTGLTEWIRGDYLIADATLNRFFALHVVALPMVILLLVVLHLGALHEVGSNNPDGVDIKKVKDKETGIPKDGIAFHPYYTVKDLFGASFFLTIAAFVLFFIPNFFGLFLEPANFVPANPLVTPIPLEPVWYFMPFYMMLRSVPSFLGTQVWGVIVMGAAVIILFGLPWFDRSPVKSIRYRPMLHKLLIAVFVLAFVTLGWLVTQGGSSAQTLLARVLTAY